MRRVEAYTCPACIERARKRHLLCNEEQKVPWSFVRGCLARSGERSCLTRQDRLAHRLKAEWLALVNETCREAPKLREVEPKLPSGHPSSVLHVMVTHDEKDTWIIGAAGAPVEWQQKADFCNGPFW